MCQKTMFVLVNASGEFYAGIGNEGGVYVEYSARRDEAVTFATPALAGAERAWLNADLRIV